jgi:glutamate/aspartate transport system substrate-binding protein
MMWFVKQRLAQAALCLASVAWWHTAVAAPSAPEAEASPAARPYFDPSADPLPAPAGRRVRIGVQRFAAPFAFERSPGDFRGYSVDLCLRLVALMRQDMGLDFVRERDVQFVPVTSKTRMMQLLAGEIDMECGSTSNTPERRSLGIAFSPTIFVSEVAALVAPAVAPHSVSLDALIQHLRQSKLPIVTTEGSTSVRHVRGLMELAGSDLLATFGTDHKDSLRRLRQGDAGAFVLDRALLATALLSNPKLVARGFALTRWSPAPGKLECYGVMTRGRVYAQFGLRVRAKMEAMRSSRELHALYVKWFQKPLPTEDQIPKLPPGQALGLGMLPQHEMLLLDPGTRPCDEAAM